MILRKFIDNGYYTIPFIEGSRIKRLPDGTKSLPIFEKGYMDRYSVNRNTKESDVGGLMTGKINNIIAIDCDNKETLQLFESLNPSYTAVFYSKGKAKGGGTILYRYREGINTFHIKNDLMELDVLADKVFVYLPTEANESKVSWEDRDIPEIQEMPESVCYLIKCISAYKNSTNNPEAIQTRSGGETVYKLAPLLKDFVDKKGEYNPKLFRIITPKSFRGCVEYIEKGHLHPNEVKEGSIYLSKLSAILAADPSVSVALYVSSINYINQMWEKPMEQTRLDETIINRIINNSATIDGKSIWVYDPHWEKYGLQFTSTNGDLMETFFDDKKGLFFVVNHSEDYIKTFTGMDKTLEFLKALMAGTISEGSYNSRSKLTRTCLEPHKPFGHIEDTDKFNLFKQNKYLGAINGGYGEYEYKRPDTVLRYLETLIPDKVMRDYTLRFFKTKFTSFDYSPVIFYFIGKSGSGKDTFCKMLNRIVGETYIARPDVKVFLEKYNGWLEDVLVIQCDDYGDKVKGSERFEVVGMMKSMTGSKEIQIRAMRSDGRNSTQRFTIIITANRQALKIDLDDRRFAIINTPNKLASAEWVSEMGGIHSVYNKITETELYDFCVYLHKEVEVLSGDDYQEPPNTVDKEKLILEASPAKDVICHNIRNNIDELVIMFLDNNVLGYDIGWTLNRLRAEKLKELYENMTEGKGSFRELLKTLKAEGYAQRQSTEAGKGSYTYFIVPGLKTASHPIVDVDEELGEINLDL